MPVETDSHQSNAQCDKYGTGPDPDAVIEFSDDTHEGFLSLVESMLARSSFIKTERGSMTIESGEMALLLDEVEPTD